MNNEPNKPAEELTEKELEGIVGGRLKVEAEFKELQGAFVEVPCGVRTYLMDVEAKKLAAR